MPILFVLTYDAPTISLLIILQWDGRTNYQLVDSKRNDHQRQEEVGERQAGDDRVRQRP